MSPLATRFRPSASMPPGTNGPGRLTAPAGPTAKPAAVVFGIILVVFLAGAIADGLTSSHHGAAPPHIAAGPVAGSGGLFAEAGNGPLLPITKAGQPPSDILAAVALPKGTVTVPGTAVDRSLGQYDASLTVQIPSSEERVIGFFRTELSATRWHLLSASAKGDGGFQFLAQHPGSDGNEWELGVTLSPTAFSSAVSGVGAPPGGVTPADVRLFVVSDQS